jgi:hypothetical protein
LRETIGIVIDAVSRDQREIMAFRQLGDGLQTPNPAPSRRRPQAAHLDPENPHTWFRQFVDAQIRRRKFVNP